MKKRLLLLALAAVCTLGASAQISTGKVESVTTQSKNNDKKTISYVRAGINFGKFRGYDVGESGDDFSIDHKRKAGYQFVYGFNKDFSLKGLYWGMEFGLGTRGDRVKYEEEYKGETYKATSYQIAHNLHVSPFNVGYKYEVIKDLKVDAHIGTYLSYDYCGQDVWDEDGEDTDKERLRDYHGYQPFDIGITYGFGVWYRDRYNLDFSFQNGFISAFDVSGDDKYNTSNFILRFGYAW